MLAIPPRNELIRTPVETPRLRLHAIDVSDGGALWEAIQGSRPTLRRWLPWVQWNQDRASSDHFAEACVQDWDDGHALRFCIRERRTHQLLGVVSLERCSPANRSCELGYWLRNEAVGKGYMVEASRGVLDLAFGRMGAHRVRVAAATDNHRSLAVIARLEFRFEGIAREVEWCDGRWLDHAVYAKLATDPP